MKGRPLEDRRATLDLYCRLMGELKRRYNSMSHMTGLAAGNQISAEAGAEFCWLQLRMMCELIALGCLVAHDDIEVTRTGKMKKLWSASEIVGALNDLHPDFYPRPARAVTDPSGKPVDVRSYDGALSLDYSITGFLGKSSLCDLTARCGDELHRGTLKAVLAGKPKTIDYSEFEKWGERIRRLVLIHEILLIDSDYRLWIDMGPDPNQQVLGWIVKSEPFPPQPPRR